MRGISAVHGIDANAVPCKALSAVRLILPCTVVREHGTMQRYAGKLVGRRARPQHQCRPWHNCHEKKLRPVSGTYREQVAISRDVARVNFARFVERALRLARQRDLTDQKIKEVTGVGPSTFHRWRRGDWGKDWPETQKVIDFCEGLGIPVEGAFDALGISGQRQETEAATHLDPDVRIILQRLADPTVSAAEKVMIRGTLKHLANLADQAERGDDGKGRRSA